MSAQTHSQPSQRLAGLGTGSADKETQKVARAAAQRQLNHEIRLVEDLLDVSRNTRGIVVLKPERIDLVEIVRRAIEAMRPGIRGLPARGHASLSRWTCCRSPRTR